MGHKCKCLKSQNLHTAKLIFTMKTTISVLSRNIDLLKVAELYICVHYRGCSFCMPPTENDTMNH